ncbi:hypothetical protein F5B21DRAFT_526306 [Xylaria acuta]|nr:hypothetical protein F5B21DRAFT_526306 [Xylaria acuta]
MASTEGQPSDSNPPTGVIKDSESNISTSAKGEHGNAATETEATIQSSEAALQKLQETIMSLEQQLDTEKKLRIKAQNDFKSVMKQWKQVAQELSKQHTDAKPFHTVTDDYLKQLVEELRYDVRCFSESYFEDLSPQQPWPQQPRRADGYLPVRVLPEDYEQCPASPVLAQSFVWRVLKKWVFERYEWPAERSVGIDLYGVSKFLRPGISLNETEDLSDYESLKKFHVWRATTANMVFSADAAVSPQDRWRKFEDSLIAEHIDPITLSFVPTSEYGRYYDLLSQIIEKALILDREISRQAAWIRWVFEDLDSHSEIVASGSINQEGLRVIVAPAMVKRGKSSGEGFEEQIELLRADSCVIQNLLSSNAYRGEGDDSFSLHDRHRWYSAESSCH